MARSDVTLALHGILVDASSATYTALGSAKRVWVAPAPESATTYPLVTIQKLLGLPQHSGVQGTPETSYDIDFQLTVWAEKASEVEAVLVAIATDLDHLVAGTYSSAAIHSAYVIAEGPTRNDPDTGLYGGSVDVRVLLVE